MNQLNLNIADFLANYWQQQPVVIKAAFTQFADPIAPDELAGLALEDATAARMVYTQKDHWHSSSDIPEDYSPLGEHNWQLLVQAINHYVEYADQLAEQFSFLPQWRFDDLMASFAVEGGGVGPHIDNYDVFIIQGQGKRQWQVGPRGNYASRNDGSNMSLVEDFEPIINEVMEPGDLLYIPVGFPHCGRSIVPSLSYSVGFRAPSQQELLSALADAYVDNDLGNERYQQADDNQRTNLIGTAQQQGFAAMLSSSLQHDGWHQALGTLLSQNRFELALEPPSEPISVAQTAARLQQGEPLYRLLGLKCLQVEGDHHNRLFFDGQSWLLPPELKDVTVAISASKQLHWAQLAPLFQDPQLSMQLNELINQGYWLFNDE
ncbi:cupin domain-containing protein [Ferrimonas lipolytica]|uniref:Cupin domain-containing protein n=1 Tax=Ferrimonas lipolytica TaxID=2724191 RepID=A0A6H1UEA7_9GAMM|nr:cupin domain-containing protein [Ferrimonas lipolytica]QIZ76673.1 cupin domain-containing protein [Ferrimonas lipolytica]